MESKLALTPLQPKGFFGTPWSEEGEWTPRPWLGWLPGARRFSFRWDAAREELQDTIDVSLIGLPLGRQVMTLRPETR